MGRRMVGGRRQFICVMSRKWTGEGYRPWRPTIDRSHKRGFLFEEAHLSQIVGVKARGNSRF